jgi:hypothetical protein
VVSNVPRVRALKTVVFVLFGNPMMAICIR